MQFLALFFARNLSVKPQRASILVIAIQLSFLLTSCRTFKEAQSSPVNVLDNIHNGVPPSKSAFRIHQLSLRLNELIRNDLLKLPGLNKRETTKINLIKILNEEHGLPRDQVKSLLSQALAIRTSGRADSASILGFKEYEIDFLLDDLYWDFFDDKALQKPGQEVRRQILLGSLIRNEQEGPMPARRQPWQILYAVGNTLQKVGVNIADKNKNLFFISIFPDDLRKSFDSRCRGNICESSIIKPFRVGATIPLTLFARVIFRYQYVIQSSLSLKQTHIDHQVVIGGRLIPISITNFLTIMIDLGAEITRTTVSKEDEGNSLQSSVRCYGSISCNTPFFNIAAAVDKQGFEFSTSIAVAGFSQNMVVISPIFKAHTQDLPFTEAEDRVHAYRDNIINRIVGPTPPLNPDIYWDSFTGAIKAPPLRPLPNSNQDPNQIEAY